MVLAGVTGAVLELGGGSRGVWFGTFEETDGGEGDRGSEVSSFGGTEPVLEAVLGGSRSVSLSSFSRLSVGGSLGASCPDDLSLCTESSVGSSFVLSGSLTGRGSVGSSSLSFCPSKLEGIRGETLEIWMSGREV